MRKRHLLGAICIASALALTLTGAGAALANPTTSTITSSVPDDQPLPPYTISNPPLPPIMSNGELSTVLRGTHAHAAYKIELPAQWNGDLVVWAHGFRGNGTVLTVDPPGFPPGFNLRQKLLDEGYAWAASSYIDNGFDIRAGVLSSKELADFFPERTQKQVNRTYIMGVSMGGYIIGRSVEQFPNYYAGALPMCGVLGDHTLLDFFLDYNLVAQDVAGVSAYPVPPDYLTTAVPQMQVKLGLAGLTPTGPDTTNDLGKQLRAITINRSGGERPGAVPSFAVWKDFLFGIAVPTSTDPSVAATPGQIAQNVTTNYQPNSPVDVNGTVLRVAPANLPARLAGGLTQVPQILGRPSAPVLSLHGLGDMFVPFSMEQAYRVDVDQHAHGGLVVQRAIRTSLHCEYSPTEVGTAWDDLVSWVHTGNRPAGDDVLSPGDPDFGCQFSDKAAYAAGTGTRRLYAPCP
jgi:hypothetical protein